MLLALMACEGDRPVLLPQPEEATEMYGQAATLSGNVLEVTVEVPPDRLQGGSLWARSTPYYYLFTVATRELFVRYPDLAAVRVVTRGTDGQEIARATLSQADLNAVTWNHMIAYASLAQTQGTDEPSHVAKLVREAEDVLSNYRYSPRYTATR